MHFQFKLQKYSNEQFSDLMQSINGKWPKEDKFNNLDNKSLLKKIKRKHRFRQFEIDTENNKVQYDFPIFLFS